MSFLANILFLILDIYTWIIIAGVVISWLIAFDVINTKNPQARNLVDLINRLTEPVFKVFRKYIPPIAGLDLTPLIVILLIYLLKDIIFRLLVV